MGFNDHYDLIRVDREIILDLIGLFKAPGSADDGSTWFESLHGLSLYNISFKRAFSRLMPLFDVEKLRSLKLCDCHYPERFMTGIIRANKRLRLRTFEFVCEHNCTVDSDDEDEEEEGLDETDVLPQFLHSFAGLENLYIAVRSVTENEIDLIPDAIAWHSSTLKTLAYHYRSYSMSNGRAIVDEDLPWSRCLRTFLEVVKLDALGVCIEPSTLVGFHLLQIHSMKGLSN